MKLKTTIITGALFIGLTNYVQAVEISIVEGDTLSELGQQHGVPYREIMQANNLNTDLIIIGQNLTIPSPNVYNIVNNSNNSVNKNVYIGTNSEVDLLAKLVHAEAKGESFQGKISIASVVLNRVEDQHFPDSISDVIYQSGQFSPTSNGSINNTPTEESYQAAREALNGNDPTNGAVYFSNPSIGNGSWINSRKQTAVIGNHVFAK